MKSDQRVVLSDVGVEARLSLAHSTAKMDALRNFF